MGRGEPPACARPVRPVRAPCALRAPVPCAPRAPPALREEGREVGIQFTGGQAGRRTDAGPPAAVGLPAALLLQFSSRRAIGVSLGWGSVGEASWVYSGSFYKKGSLAVLEV